jgi:hydroxymethylpyrimidine pyrophosphatase-like HAD family hydrolase
VIELSSAQAREILAPITHVYTDLDGTLFAPGGRLLCNNAGEPSTALAQALVKLKQLGITVTIVTGRNREQCVEILRILDLEHCFAEMGTVIIHGTGYAKDERYCLGVWDSQSAGDYSEQTPCQVIEASGMIERLLTKFAGKLEAHQPYADRREVTRSFRGNVDVACANLLLEQGELPLELLDNGVVHPKTHGLDSDITEIHAYHLLPKGASKAQAVAGDIARRQLKVEQTIAIGDAVGDIEMGGKTGALVVVRNALKTDTVRQAIEQRSAQGLPTLVTQGYTADGWVEFAKCLAACVAPGAK